MNHPWRVAPASIFAALWMLGAALPAHAQSAATPAAKAAEKKPAALTCDRANFRVILDVGHSEEVPGAISARGATEYSYNLNLAKKIQAKLHEAGFSKAHLLITPGKAIAGLVSRVHYVSHNPADLFLAIHHDAAPDKFVEKWTYEGKNQLYCDRFKGHSIFVSQHNPEYRESLQFARLLGMQLKAKGLQYAAHYTESFMGRRQRQLVDADAGVYRFDNLVVLMSTNIPAVLFEAGSIINRDEELEMAKPAHQDMLAATVTTAVENFCQFQAPRKNDQRIARRQNSAAAASATPAVPQLLPFTFFASPQ